MSFANLLKLTVTVVRASFGARDAYNNPIPDGETRTTYLGHYEQARSGGSEETEDRDLQIEHGVLYLPAGADIVASDRVEVAGGAYEVTAPPSIIRNPRLGNVHHLEVQLARVDQEAASGS